MSNPWMKFYPSDWRSDPALRMCSIGARGLWMEMLCVMHENAGELSVNGKPLTERQLATLAGCPEVSELLSELEDAGVFSRRDDGTIYSRRMIRDAEKAEADKANGKKGGNRALMGGVNPEVKAQKPEARSQKPEAAALPKLDGLVDKLSDAAGIKGNLTPSLAFAGEIIGLVQAGYDLESDILPAIRARPNPRARSWAYFVPQIRDFRERRDAVSAVKAPERKQIDWVGRLKAWKDDQIWPHSWGPKPGEAGCQMPTDLE